MSGPHSKNAPVQLRPRAAGPDRRENAPRSQFLAERARAVIKLGPKEVYVVAGTFNDGACDYPADTFLHAPAGSWHVPATTGCMLFLFYPAG